MSDMSCRIQIKFEFMGITRKADMMVNYFADDEGQDERAKEFFRNAYADGTEVGS